MESRKKRISFRLDSLMNQYIRDKADYLNISMTDLILNCITGAKLCKIEPVSARDEKFYEYLRRLDNETKQCIYALNYHLKKQAEIEFSPNLEYLSDDDREMLQEVNLGLKNVYQDYVSVTKMTGILERGFYHYKIKYDSVNSKFLDAMNARPKTEQIVFRVDLLTYLAIRDYAKSLNMTITDLILRSILNSQIVHINRISNLDVKFYSKIGQIVNDLNRCAKSLNILKKRIENKKVFSIEEKEILKEIDLQVQKIWKFEQQLLKPTVETEKELYRYIQHCRHGEKYSKFLKTYDPYLFKQINENLKELDKN